MTSKIIPLAIAVSLLTIAGCRTESFNSSYGASNGYAGRNSVNGFGALRTTFVEAGFQDRDVRRLSERVKQSRVIVWTPQITRNIATDVTRWMESWFRTGNKTLIYIAPDSGSETEYWESAIASAPPKQRLEYRRRAAKQINSRMEWTLNRYPVASNGWFTLIPKSQQTTTFAEPGQTDSDSKQLKEPILTEYIVTPFEVPTTAAASPATTAAPVTINTGPTGPNGGYVVPVATEASKTKVEFRPLLETESGDTIVAEITSDRWQESRIIVVASGSLLTNFAFTRQSNRDLADRIVKESKTGLKIAPPATRSSPAAGFLTSSYMPISVSEKKSDVPIASGMELLTVYPISLVTIHLTFLGIIACIVLLPIFGRPRTVDRGSQTNFGDHLDAVAQLMNAARGQVYARNRISEYMRRMKGETSGKWVLPDKKTNPPKKSPDAQPDESMGDLLDAIND